MFRVVDEKEVTIYSKDYYTIKYEEDGEGIIMCGDKPIVRVQATGQYTDGKKVVSVFSCISKCSNLVKA